MILQENYDQCTIRTKILLSCDYCYKTFERVKKSVNRSRKIIDKDSCCNKECISKKQKESNLKLYGSENFFASETFKKKQETTCESKFGVKNFFQSDDFKEKRKKTLIEKYGVDSPLRSKTIYQKHQNTIKDKYGVENISQIDGVEQKKQESYMKHGDDYIDKFIKKREETCEEKYGVKSYTQTDEYWHEREITCLNKYGVSHPHQLPEIHEKMEKTNSERYGVNHYPQSQEFKDRYVQHCMNKFGVPNPLCLKQNQKYGKIQDEIKEWLRGLDLHFEKNNYDVLKTQEIDLYHKEMNIGIEYCGLYWHNEFSPQPRGRSYHYDKYKKCLTAGIRLITIFEDEWINRQNQCKNALEGFLGKFQKRIPARKCVSNEMSKEECNNFLENNHIQGASNQSTIQFGIYQNDELLGVITLGKHHRQGQNENIIVLKRMCFKNGVQIIGGASKLFSKACQWAKENKYVKILSWSDNRWSSGKIYETLGFRLDKELKPDYSYVNLKNCSRISKQSQMKSLTGCPKNTTERNWAINNNLSRIWDCGKKRWIMDII